MTDRRPRFGLPNRKPNAALPQTTEPAPEVSMEARPEDVATPVERSVVDAAIYVAGVRSNAPTTVTGISKLLRRPLIGTVYGMNFDMPELHWAFGYLFALFLMAVVSVALWFIFRKRGWL